MFIKLRENKAFTLVEIMIVVAIIGLLVAIAIPNFVRARTTTRTNVCKNNLRIIEHAKQQWAMDNNAAAGAAVIAADLDTYIKGGTVDATSPVKCPAGGATATFSSSYTINAVDTNPVCIIDATNHHL